jgi:pyrophosphate--fructose-6-phosphate 1-phosphotransferase
MKVAMLTAGGLAPCLSTAVASLIEKYTESAPDVELIAYRSGYAGLLKGDSFVITENARKSASALYKFGGSPIGNSRVKLTNKKDLVKRGLVSEGQDPLKVAAEQLQKDGVDVFHTIGGDDTNTTAADLAAYLAEQNYNLRVIGLPKTIDNDIVPIKQSLGAVTAAEQGAIFARNIVSEYTASPRSLIIHEVMGRHCGYLTVETALKYRDNLKNSVFAEELGLDEKRWDIHAVYIPEVPFDIAEEGKRLKKIMDEVGNVNIFLAEGAITEDQLVKSLEEKGEEVPRDAFGHIRLDDVNPGVWFSKQLAPLVQSEKVQIQKSGYFARSAASNEEDLNLIERACTVAVKAALNGESGVVGEDDNYDGKNPNAPKDGSLSVIDFTRIKGAKAFDANDERFVQMLKEIGQN